MSSRIYELFCFIALTFVFSRQAASFEQENSRHEESEASDTDYENLNKNSTVFIPKCCPWGQALLNSAEGCIPSNATFTPPFSEEEPTKVDLIIGFKCEYGKYPLEPHTSSEDEFHLQPDGFLRLPFQEDNLLSPLEYCFESVLVESGLMVLPFVCFPQPTDEDYYWKKLSRIIFPIGSLTSVPFLLLVVIVHCGIPELRTVNGKVLACHSACLAFAYASLSFVQIFGDQLPHGLCVAMVFITSFKKMALFPLNTMLLFIINLFSAFIVQFFFMACFFWLNLLCLHTWRKLNKPNTIGAISDVKEKMLFILYSVYGWGVPIIIIAVSILMDLIPTIPSAYLKPNFGLNSCWFNSDAAALPYFYGPIAVILCINLILFAMTTRLIHRSDGMVPHRITTLNQAVMGVIIQKRKRSFVQALLLFLAMGLNWLTEVISWFVGGPPQIWLVTDIINTLQGIVVFYIFVVRDPWTRRLAIRYFRRICCCREQIPVLEGLSTQSNGTSAKKFSMQQSIPLVPLK